MRSKISELLCLRRGKFTVFLIILCMICFQMIRLGDTPGLYFDAMNPDYIATKLMFPELKTPMWQISWPWLCQLYHGNIGILITMISVFITGGTSVLQHHLTYAFICSICIYLVYIFLTHHKVGVSKIWAAGTVILLASWPGIVTVIITQYYMSLFGSICVFAAMILFLNWMEQIEKKRFLYEMYILLGVAFYSYFNFLFFLPAAVVATCMILKKYQILSIDYIIELVLCYLMGCGLYIVGYAQIMLSFKGVAITNSLRLVMLISVYFVLYLLLYMIKKRLKFRIILIFFMLLFAVFIVGLCLGNENLRSTIQSLSIFGSGPITVFTNVKKVINDYIYILSGNSAENLIVGYSISYLHYIILPIVGVITFTVIILEAITKKNVITWKCIGIVGISFLLCCIPLANRMQPQHYVPMIFITFCYCSCAIYVGMSALCKITQKKHNGTIAKSVLALSIVFLLINQWFDYRIFQEIIKTQGNGYYTSQINKLSETALEQYQNGEKEFYVFIDWGFFSGFNYLTCNCVPFIDHENIDVFCEYYEKGYDLIACYFSETDTEYYRRLFNTVSGDESQISVHERKNPNGSTAFYEIRLSQP